jgi:hypothetical protein
MRTKIFLASSSELEGDRKEFEILINRKNKDWADRGAFLDLVVWEDFLDAMSKTRLQDEYNKAIQECDVFVMLFCTKVGKYTEEEFETAFGQFKATNKPLIYTYFKDAEITTASANKDDLKTLWVFQEKLQALGHFQTFYKNIDALKFLFNQQLDKLAEKGFIRLIDESQNGIPSARENESLEAVRAILKGCYRRAVFTRTYAQIDLEAMFASITECRELVQLKVPSVSEPHMSQTAADLMSAFYGIEREKDKQPLDFSRIDAYKLEVLRRLTLLSQLTGISYTIPRNLTEEVFFSKTEAALPPTVSPSQ